MDQLTTKFVNAQKEFIKSNASEKSVEDLYDLIYLLQERKERNFEENYILAQIYYLIGENTTASIIIKEALVNCKNREITRLNAIDNKIKKERNVWTFKKTYRDLRDAKLIKSPTVLTIEDFCISKERDDLYVIEISEKHKNIVVLNKNKKNTDTIFCKKEPNENLLLFLVEYVKWIGQIKDELISFYNNFSYKFKNENVGQKWFDGLDVIEFNIYIDENENTETDIGLIDYSNYNRQEGFILEIQNMALVDLNFETYY